MRRYFGITLITSLAVLGIWRGLAGKSNAHAEAPKETRPGMTQAEWRYHNSQASHWRQCMLKK